jgi:hypothetical protein
MNLDDLNELEEYEKEEVEVVNKMIWEKIVLAPKKKKEKNKIKAKMSFGKPRKKNIREEVSVKEIKKNRNGSNTRTEDSLF